MTFPESAELEIAVAPYSSQLKEIQFKYFERPLQYAIYTNEKCSCDICNRKKKCFDAGAFPGNEKINAICPECLVSGKLYPLDISTCEGDMEELLKQLNSTGLTEEQIQSAAKKRTDELQKTTPHLLTCQVWRWPCSEGDYCKFIAFGSRPLYYRLSANGNPEQFFKESVYHNLKTEVDADIMWKLVPEQKIIDVVQALDQDIAFYIFKSLNSNKYITIWDSI